MNRRPLPRLGLALVGTLAVIALAAPLLANDRPLLVTTDTGVMLPAVGELAFLGGLVEQAAWARRDWSRPLDGERFRLATPIPYSFRATDLAHGLSAPSRTHLLGTDTLGRDLAARLIHGASTSLEVGMFSTAVALGIGVLLGSLAGFMGRSMDFVVARGIEVVLCFPTFFLILTVLAFRAPSMPLLFTMIGLTRWPRFARYTRGEVLRFRAAPFVDAARAAGAGPYRTLLTHVLPHALTPVLVVATFSLAGAMVVEAGLSFLGFGVPEPQPSWGSLLSDAQGTGRWWLLVFPGLALTLAVTGVQFLGEGLRDRMAPR